MKIPKKTSGFIFLFYSFTFSGFAQNFDKGKFVDFDYGPHGVYGARPLVDTKYKEFWQLSRIGKSTALAVKFNEAGIQTTSMIISFKNGLLSHLEEVDQWGDTIRYKTFQPFLLDEKTRTSIVVQFCVDSNDLLHDVTAISGPDELREESIRLAKKVGIWVPAVYNGKRINAYPK